MDVTTATLIAASLAATVALVVALVNGMFARKIAIDNAYRAYRAELAEPVVVESRKLLQQIELLEEMRLLGKFDGYQTRLAEMVAASKPGVDRRTPADQVFAEAIELFRTRRTEVAFCLWKMDLSRDSGRPEQVAAAVTTTLVCHTYIAKIADILQLAAEGYIFNLRKQCRRARRLLYRLDGSPLSIRILARLPAEHRAASIHYDPPQGGAGSDLGTGDRNRP